MRRCTHRKVEERDGKFYCAATSYGSYCNGAELVKSAAGRWVYAANVKEDGPRGTCQVCFRSMGIKTGLIAHHGYRRPGDGADHGRCFAERELPYEESCEVTKKYLVMLRAEQEKLITFKTHLEANDVETLYHKRIDYNLAKTDPKRETLIPVAKGAPAVGNPYIRASGYIPSFDELRGRKVQSVKDELRGLAEIITLFEKKVAHWAPRKY